ncbi:MAG: hypothetical protein VW405_15580 [Rhodospirillaceae bacterium]
MSKTTQAILITPPDIRLARFRIRGTAPLVLHRFSVKAKEQIKATQEQGSSAKSRKNREAKDFDSLYRDAQYFLDDGSNGIAAPAFRSAMISAARVAGFVMTRAKLSVFVEPDGFDVLDGTPLVRITKGAPEKYTTHARNESGVIDIRCRPMWRDGWEAVLTVRHDAGTLTVEDVTNLLARAGLQVGIGEGRPDSKKSCGLGFGLFEIVNGEE